MLFRSSSFVYLSYADNCCIQSVKLICISTILHLQLQLSLVNSALSFCIFLELFRYFFVCNTVHNSWISLSSSRHVSVLLDERNGLGNNGLCGIFFLNHILYSRRLYFGALSVITVYRVTTAATKLLIGCRRHLVWRVLDCIDNEQTTLEKLAWNVQLKTVSDEEYVCVVYFLYLWIRERRYFVSCSVLYEVFWSNLIVMEPFNNIVGSLLRFRRKLLFVKVLSGSYRTRSIYFLYCSY